MKDKSRGQRPLTPTTLIIPLNYREMSIQLISSELALFVRVGNEILTSFCQLLAIFVIFSGVMRALIIVLKDFLFKPQTTEGFQRGRLAMGYSFSLGLSFLVGASILKTMISSRWDDIARLIVIIAVRTILNYLLTQAISTSNLQKEPDLQHNSQTTNNQGLSQ
ncbi:DUF1622 domain-containing protein [Crocosphaera sp. XPORK-15E]|uniref:DUF1622 domain-containing protein n=1 Tax=Crocosphaera sp. XPORK-15E TaxID=3110247 RepID=UPI002B21F450|nr:DUF1622 domain-containing protein [Crocosphaera sp. XPORK-15E]MEA5533576.1 DUF1622 domain-containing protein [Crocosphaera sp. XPORK-15E]